MNQVIFVQYFMRVYLTLLLHSLYTNMSVLKTNGDIIVMNWIIYTWRLNNNWCDVKKLRHSLSHAENYFPLKGDDDDKWVKWKKMKERKKVADKIWVFAYLNKKMKFLH